MFFFNLFRIVRKRKKCFTGLLHIMDDGQKENSKRPCVFIFSVILINLSGKTFIFVVIYFTAFVKKKMNRNKVISYQLLNENDIESLITIRLGSYLLVIIMNGLLMNGKMLFLQMNLILRFSAEKNRSFVRRLPSKVSAPFNFQLSVQGEAGLISVWGGESDGGQRN